MGKLPKSVKSKLHLFLLLASVFFDWFKVFRVEAGVVKTDVVHLTLNPKVQAVLEESMRGVKGTAVILDAQSGDVLGIVSNPCKEKASASLTIEKWQALSNDPRDSFMSGAITAHAPGGTFTAVAALAALKSGKLTPETVLNCSGRLMIKEMEFKCWKTEGHGDMDIKKALTMSCGIFFYQTGIRTGVDPIVDMARRAGFGERSEVLAHEDPGLVPSPEWRQTRVPKTWSEGDTAYLSIGQGSIRVTSLQQAAFMVAVANGGTLYYPRLIKEVTAPDGNIKESIPAKRVHSELKMKPAALEAVRAALLSVVEEGAGRSAKVDGVKIAGKTGVTSWWVRGDQGSMERVTLAGFCGFVPYDQPQYAFSFLISGAESGGRTAGPIVHNFLEKILKKAETK